MIRTQNRAVRPRDESNADIEDWLGGGCGQDAYRVINGIVYFRGEKTASGPACSIPYICNPARLPPRPEERDEDWDCTENVEDKIKRGQCLDRDTAVLLTKGKTTDKEVVWGDYEACGSDPRPIIDPRLQMQCAPKVNMELKPGLVQYVKKPKGPEMYTTFEENCNVPKEEPVPHINLKCATPRGPWYYGQPHPDQPRIDREITDISSCNPHKSDCPMPPTPSCGNDRPSFDW
jgi:hypothetical protein